MLLFLSIEFYKDKLIKAIHKEIKVLFGIDPPEPEEVFFHYWENGCHFWKSGEDMNKVYEKMMKNRVPRNGSLLQ